MSNRTSAMKSAMPNPAKYRFDWRSKHKKFGFYDPSKEGDDRQSLKKLPFKFLVLDTLHAVAGYNNKLSMGIWSNEVSDLKSEILTVRFQGGGEIARGFYSDIKDKCNLQKGVYCKVAYILLMNGELARLEVKGTAAFAFSDVLNKMGDKKYTHFMECLSFTEHKNGDVDYTVPVFTEGEAIDAKLNEAADVKFDELEAYLKSRSNYFEEKGEASVTAAVDELATAGEEPSLKEILEQEEDDLPF